LFLFVLRFNSPGLVCIGVLGVVFSKVSDK